MKIVETDNFGGDYPNESFLNIPNIYEKEAAQKVADAINSCFNENYLRFWKVVENDYELVPGFQP